MASTPLLNRVKAVFVSSGESVPIKSRYAPKRTAFLALTLRAGLIMESASWALAPNSSTVNLRLTLASCA